MRGKNYGLLLVLLASACGGGPAGGPNNVGPFELSLGTTGLGQLFPYRIAQVDEFGNPTSKILNITSVKILKDNTSSKNGVLPVATWPSTKTLPNGSAGNHYLMLRFTHDLDIRSILSSRAADQVNSGLTGSLQVIEYDPLTEDSRIVKGRGFVGGYTFLDDLKTPGFDLIPTRAVVADKNGVVTVADSRVVGFPLGFPNDEELVRPDTFVFVPDTDGNLATFETFPTNKVIRVVVSNSVLDFRGKPLVREAQFSTVVGSDTIAPQVLGFTKVNKNLVRIIPGNNQKDVDPSTTIRIEFSKPIQPREVGDFFSVQDKTPKFSGINLSMVINNSNVPVLYYADPESPANLTTYIITPAFQLLGESTVSVKVNNTIHGLSGNKIGTTITTLFKTGKGFGLVNAPVAPEAIYVGRSAGNVSGVSVIDLNGFGQGTGDIKDTNWPRNPNIGQPGVVPPLTVGKTNMDAGGKGPLTLTRNTNLSDLLLDSTIVSRVGDIQIGQPLDKVFNNENINPNVSRLNQVNPATLTRTASWGNSISIAPHPNPPKLLIPPPNPTYAIFGEEPTMTTSTDFPRQIPGVNTTVHPPAGPCTPSPVNRLVKGNPFAKDINKLGVFGGIYNSVFVGPAPPPGNPQPPTPFCPFTSRQQIGHFLYVLDRGKRQVLVVNSNRFTVLERIRLPDPFSMAVSPNLKRLAVTNFSAGTVSFIDIDPGSPSFHTIVHEEKVGKGPTGVAWQPEGEDVFIVNSLSDSMSILRGSDMKLRKEISRSLNRPIEVAITPRQGNFGWQTGIYFAYVLNSDGSIAVFESGPDGVNGIGFDNVVGVPDQAHFRGARTIQPDIRALNSAIWIAHRDQSGEAQISHLELTTSPTGQLPIDANTGYYILPPTFRQREWTINGRLGGLNSTTRIRTLLSGKDPADIAVDDVFNWGALPDYRSTFISNLTYADHSGKGMLKSQGGGGGFPSSVPRLMFIALQDVGKVDVVEIDTGQKLAEISAPGVTSLSHYWRQ